MLSSITHPHKYEHVCPPRDPLGFGWRKIRPGGPLTSENGLVYYASLPVDAVPDSRE